MRPATIAQRLRGATGVGHHLRLMSPRISGVRRSNASCGRAGRRWVIAPGFVFASAISSGSVLTPSVGDAPTDIGWSEVKPIGMKSRGSISGRLGARPGRVRNVDSAGP